MPSTNACSLLPHVSHIYCVINIERVLMALNVVYFNVIICFDVIIIVQKLGYIYISTYLRNILIINKWLTFLGVFFLITNLYFLVLLTTSFSSYIMDVDISNRHGNSKCSVLCNNMYYILKKVEACDKDLYIICTAIQCIATQARVTKQEQSRETHLQCMYIYACIYYAVVRC